jgi:Flp pilus assembly pilin Flp
MAEMIVIVRRLLDWEDGQDLIEYGLLAALIAVVAIVGITSVGDTIYSVFWSGIGQAI